MEIGATRPSGSNKLFTQASTPLRVKGLLVLATRKVNVSLLRSQFNPRLRCIGGESVSRSRSFKSLAYSEDGNACITAGQLDAILWRWRLDIASIPRAAVSRSTA